MQQEEQAWDERQEGCSQRSHGGWCQQHGGKGRHHITSLSSRKGRQRGSTDTARTLHLPFSPPHHAALAKLLYSLACHMRTCLKRCSIGLRTSSWWRERETGAAEAAGPGAAAVAVAGAADSPAAATAGAAATASSASPTCLRANAAEARGT